MNNQAWEITDEDIEIVLRAHGVAVEPDDAREFVDEEQVIAGVLHYTDLDDQCNCALSMIEAALQVGCGWPVADNKFAMPR